MKKSALLFLISTLFCSCQKEKENHKPNVVVIMVDDMGRECLSSYGSLSYQSPVLDSLAENGIQFTQCISQPLCTPSRVKIMTGKYNYLNYEYFGYLGGDQYTFFC
jgi:arylsulfatase A